MSSGESVQDQSCIEVRGLLGNVRHFSVTEYESALAKAWTCAYPRALSFFELMSTVDAPAVHELTSDGRSPATTEFRIGDWETYSAQMGRLLGLVPHGRSGRVS
jgi:hypothetical protein